MTKAGLEYDVSLLLVYTASDANGMEKTMLDVQYRMWYLNIGLLLTALLLLTVTRPFSALGLMALASQQEGNDAEAARLTVAQELNVKLLVDDNDVTISGHLEKTRIVFSNGALRQHDILPPQNLLHHPRLPHLLLHLKICSRRKVFAIDWD